MAIALKRPHLLLFLAVTALCLPFHLRPDNFIVDDGYFYPEIARHIVQGQGSTFNGILPTNGYHPLWMIVCCAGAWITTASGPLVQLLTLVQDGLTFCSLAMLLAIGRAAQKRGTLLGLAPVLFLATVLGIWRLLEANLSLVLQLAVLLCAIPLIPSLHQRLRHARRLALSILIGLTLLARLDLIFFALIVFVYDASWNDPERGLATRIRDVSWQGATVTAVVAPYLYWNFQHFRHLLPISGAIKSTFPHPQAWHFAPFLCPVFASVALSGYLGLKKKRTYFETLCMLTGAAAAVHLVYTLSFGGVSPWYLTTGYLNVSLCMMWILDQFTARHEALRRLEVPAVCIVLVFFFLLASLRLFSNFSYSRMVHGEVSFRTGYTEPKRALAEELKKSLPAGSRIFIFDAPGGVAFYSGMSILPADGLVGDYQYNVDVVREGFARYAMDHHVDYLIMPYLLKGQNYDRLFLQASGDSSGQTVAVRAPLTGKSAGTLDLLKSHLLFEAPEINPDLQASLPKVGVWRLVADSK